MIDLACCAAQLHTPLLRSTGHPELSTVAWDSDAERDEQSELIQGLQSPQSTPPAAVRYKHGERSNLSDAFGMTKAPEILRRDGHHHRGVKKTAPPLSECRETAGRRNPL